MSNQFSRPALGQLASIGSLYDAKTDVFLPSSLLKRSIAPGVLQLNQIGRTEIQVSHLGTYEDKFKRLGITPELGGSLLAGLFQAGGAGHYLNDNIGNDCFLESAVYHTIKTVQEKVDLINPALKAGLALDILRASEVTHIVTEVEYGAQTVLTSKHWYPQDSLNPALEGRFRQQSESFATSVKSISSPDSNGMMTQSTASLPVEITAYSTILGSEGILMHEYQEARTFLELMPVHIKNENDGKGQPILYRLLPISMLSLFNLVQIEVDIVPTLPSNECLKRVVELFDEFRACRQKLNAYYSYVSKNKLVLPPNHISDVSDRVRDIDLAEQNLRNDYASLLPAVRAGTADLEKLWQLTRDYTDGNLSPKKISTVAGDHGEKVRFIGKMVAKGAKYIGYNGLDAGTELFRHADRDCYIFSFSDIAKQEVISWEANQALLESILADHQQRAFVAIVDCDATSMPLERSIISHYKNGVEISRDLFEEQLFSAENCFARHDPQTLESGDDIHRPVKRRFVRTACPGRNCDDTVTCDWLCSKCKAPIEFGFTDHFIYCDCGRSLYSNFDFKCNGQAHGPSFFQYDPELFKSLLKSLDQSNYLNVLILGETGVGKSTFINAFINYLHFQTLDEALAADNLHWVIPCVFSANAVHRSTPDSEIEERVVKVGMKEDGGAGSKGDERDGSQGESATQETRVYPITVGTTTYRLIDTPGIGDTRGLEYDKKNMADILATLNSYDELHGVLILLKSNNSRLTVTFSFCVTELLTHLHRSATQNMVFGFTNTRITNYAPGDTYGPLKALIKKHPDVGLSLKSNTIYCFDSESFRYLAAHKNGVLMSNAEDFKRSWKHSRDEAWRLLDHFKTKPPHEIRNTISLNRTRQLIAEMTKPMAEISTLIRTNIQIVENEMQVLKDARLSGDQLRTRLHPQKYNYDL